MLGTLIQEPLLLCQLSLALSGTLLLFGFLLLLLGEEGLALFFEFLLLGLELLLISHQLTVLLVQLLLLGILLLFLGIDGLLGIEQFLVLLQEFLLGLLLVISQRVVPLLDRVLQRGLHPVFLPCLFHEIGILAVGLITEILILLLGILHETVIVVREIILCIALGDHAQECQARKQRPFHTLDGF